MSTKAVKPHPEKLSVVVEVGADRVKLLQFEKRGAGVALARAYVRKFDAVNENLADAVRAAVKEGKFARVPVLAALPRQMVNIRMLELPSTDPGEIADMVDLQAGKQTPYSRDQVLCGYRPLGSGRDGYTRVMLAIVQRSVLRERYAVLEEAGLDVQRMSVTTEGLLNWYAFGGRDGGAAGEAAALLDVDAAYTDFTVVARSGLVFTRSIMIGADQLLPAFEEWRERFVRELQRSLDICRGEAQGVAPGRLVLCGAEVAPLGSALAEALDLTIDVCTGLAGAARTASVTGLDGGDARAASLTAAIGMALAPNALVLDLVPDVVRMRKRLHRRARRSAVFVSLAMAALVAASFFGLTKLALARERLVMMKAAVEAAQPGVDRVERMQDLVRVVRERQDPRFSALRILTEIHRVVAGNMYFKGVDIDRPGRRVQLTGSAGSTRDIRALVTNLEQSPLFEGAREGGTTTLNPRSNRYEFEVICSLEMDE